MMKRLLFLCFLAGANGLAQRVTGVSYDPTTLSHSQVQINFTSTGWIGVGNPQLRIRIVAAPATCTSGSGGMVQGNVAPTFNSPSWVNISGMAPSTTYNICPELAVDGSHWFGGTATTVTTLALPAVHPALPTPPVTFSTDYPSTTNYTVVNVASDCSDWPTQLQNAVSARLSHGTVINLPVGGVYCTQQITQYVLPVDPDVKTFQPSAVSTTNNTIALPAPASEGQVIRFGSTSYVRLPGSGGSNTAGPLISGMPYFVHVVSGNTVQIYAGHPMLQGGTLCLLTDQGSVGGGGGIAYVTEPRSPNWVIVRTATPDSQFVPEHSRVQGPPISDGITADLYPSPPAQWASKMAQIQFPYSFIANNNALLTFGGGDLAISKMPANIRFTGVEFSHGADPYEFTTSDPLSWGAWIVTTPESENIIFDRCWFHSGGTPERETTGFSWNGMNQAIIDTYIDGMHYFHSAMTGFGISGPTGGTSATIASGSAGFGAGHGSLTTAANISWSGAPSVASAHRAFMYFGMTGNQLNLAFPPGITPAVTGASNYHIVSLQGYGAQNGPAVADGAFPHYGSNQNYYVDPIVSANSSCTSTTSLFAELNTAAAPQLASGYPGTYGLQFTADAAQYICGIRWWRSAGEAATTRMLGLWSISGTQLASAQTNESGTGWQTGTFAAPYLVSAGANYVVSFTTNTGPSQAINAFQNADYYAHGMHVSGAYVDSNGAGDATDAWPRAVSETNGYQGPAAGEIAYIDLSSTGTTTGLRNADLQGTHVSANASSEGSQGMIGGVGPGPYIYRDNFLECTGNCWHHDDGAGFWDPGRNDYTYVRNYWRMPASTWWTSQYSDGMRYGTRHFLEWKAGQRVSIVGNIFNRWYTDTTPTDEPVEVSCKVGQCTSDVRFESNSMFHGPGGPLLGGPQESGCCREPVPAARYLLRNNLAWDIDGRYCVQGGGFACPTQGWFMIGPPGEDTILDHNTVLLNTATSTVPVLILTGDNATEGVQVTNNFIPAEGGRYSLTAGLQATDSCYAFYVGEGTGNCKFTPSYTWAGNVFLGSGVSAAQIQSAWSTHVNSANGQPLNYFIGNQVPVLSNPGWFGFNSAASVLGGNFRLTSAYCSGCGHPGTDLRDVGADIDALEAAQGAVTLNGVPNSSITANSATVVFVAPDSAGCSVDYSSTDATLAASFTRATDAGGPRVRNVLLSGLSNHTVYFYRVNCAVQQPKGQFRTR